MFGALLEFALVNYASRSDKHREKQRERMKDWEIEHMNASMNANNMDNGHLDNHSNFAMVGMNKMDIGYSTTILILQW